MIEKLQKYVREHGDFGTTDRPIEVIEMVGKINEIIETVNKLGNTLDEFTGSAPEFRR